MKDLDRLSALFSARRNRRATLGAGLAAAATAGAVRFGAALAQDGSPVPVEPAAGKAMYLFVQAFEGGTWTANADGTFTLTVSGGVASTIYFSDRPERVFGASPTQTFLDGLGFQPDNPPNAAIVVNADGVEDIVVIELLDPVYDPAAGTLTYTVKVLEAYDEEGLGNAVARKPEDDDLPAEFGEGALFIDDCLNGQLTCWWENNRSTIVDGAVPCCYTYPEGCIECPGQDYAALCNQYVVYCQDRAEAGSSCATETTCF